MLDHVKVADKGGSTPVHLVKLQYLSSGSISTNNNNQNAFKLMVS